MNRQLILTLGAAVLLSACATSQPPATSSTAAKFAKYDLNGDGFLNRAEFAQAVAERRFAFYDTNKDGVIDQAEWTHVWGEDRGSSFAKVNKSRNGKITLAEFKAGVQLQAARGKMFDRIDKNKSGRLSLKEVEAAFDEREQLKP